MLVAVDLPDVNFKHRPQVHLVCEGVADEIEANVRASRAMRSQEIMVGLGVNDQGYGLGIGKHGIRL
jgi:hypothetical protein